MHTFQGAETVTDKHSECDSYVMEEDDLDGLDVISDEMNETVTVLSETGPLASSAEDDENGQTTSSVINIRTQVRFLDKLIIGL